MINSGGLLKPGEKIFIKDWRIPISNGDRDEFETTRYGVKYLIRRLKKDIGAGNDIGYWYEVIKQITYPEELKMNSAEKMREKGKSLYGTVLNAKIKEGDKVYIIGAPLDSKNLAVVKSISKEGPYDHESMAQLAFKDGHTERIYVSELELASTMRNKLNAKSKLEFDSRDDTFFIDGQKIGDEVKTRNYLINKYGYHKFEADNLIKRAAGGYSVDII